MAVSRPPRGIQRVSRAGAARQRAPFRTEMGPGALLGVIMERGGGTRKDLIERTGLARATMEARLSELLATGFLVEDVAPTTGGGRPPRRVAFNPSGGHLVCVELGSRRSRIGISDLGGHLLATEGLDLDMDAGPGVLLGSIGTQLRALIARRGVDPGSVLGVGVGLPSPVELGGRMARPPSTGTGPLEGQWADLIVGQEIAAFLPALGISAAAPVVVDKDANLMALGEWKSSWPQARDLIVVNVDIGLACGIVAGGQVVRGAAGMAGDLAHVPDPDSDVRCRCGEVGCAEVTASLAAIGRELGYTTDEREWADQIARSLQEGVPEVVAAVSRVGGRLGRVIAGAVATLNPRLVVVGGRLAGEQPLFVDVIREAAVARLHPLVAATTQVVGTSGKQDACLQGAAFVAREKALDPLLIDALILARLGNR